MWLDYSDLDLSCKVLYKSRLKLTGASFTYLRKSAGVTPAGGKPGGNHLRQLNHNKYIRLELNRQFKRVMCALLSLYLLFKGVQNLAKYHYARVGQAALTCVAAHFADATVAAAEDDMNDGSAPCSWRESLHCLPFKQFTRCDAYLYVTKVSRQRVQPLV